MDFTTLEGMRKNWNEVCQAPNKCFQNLSYVREKLDAGTDAMKKIKIAFIFLPLFCRGLPSERGLKYTRRL